MLHRILHHPFSLSSSAYLSPHLLSSSSSSPRRIQGMELVQGDFGGGFVPKTAANAVVLLDDVGGVNGGGGGTGDDFFVDELLDFSNGYSETEEQAPQTEEPPENEQNWGKSSLVSQEKQALAAPPPPENGPISPGDDFGSFHESKLIVPAEGLESLEWLSHFVEDSFSNYPLTGKLPTEDRSKPATPAKEPPCFTTPVQTKARTKRARTGVRVWPVLSPSFAETSTSSSSSSTSSTTSFAPPTLWIVESGDSSSGKAPAAKKRKGRPADLSGGGTAQQRRCSHCGVTKTPQWRAGPLGLKTLCNACGVRFKSGRLLPEYRPACSPTFSTELHSNSHRKVLEMRRKKELEN